MATLLEQLKSELPDHFHRRRVFFPADVAAAQEIAERALKLAPRAVRYLLMLDRFEERPPEGHPKRAAHDVLTAALAEVTPLLTQRPPVEDPMGDW